MRGDWTQAGEVLLQHLVSIAPEFELADMDWYANKVNVRTEALQNHLRNEQLCVSFVDRVNEALEQRGWARFVIWDYLGQEYYQSVEVLDEEFVVERKGTDV
tara:strand:- start:299 stop:604 length:306 start_codon:yes stop_codon:yes gene_type:complete